MLSVQLPAAINVNFSAGDMEIPLNILLGFGRCYSEES